MNNDDTAEAEKIIAEVEQAMAEQDRRLQAKAQQRTLVINHNTDKG